MLDPKGDQILGYIFFFLNLQLISYVLGLQDTFIFFFKRMRLKFHFLLGYVWLEVKYGGWKIKERKWVCMLFG